MTRIVHIISGLETGGGELFLERLIQSDIIGEFENRVISLQGLGAVGKRLLHRGVSVEALHTGGVIGAIPHLLRLSRLLSEARPDLVQSWLYNGNLAASAAKYLGRERFPILWSIRHSLDGWTEETWRLRCEIRLGGRLSRIPVGIIFNSARSAHQHERLGYPKVKARIIPNGFDVSKFAPNTSSRSTGRAALAVRPDDVVLGMVGRFHPLKDHLNFLRAARIVSKAFPKVRFVLAGRQVNSGNSMLAAFVNDLGIQGQVKLLGECSDVACLMNSLDIYVSSSSSEAFPNAVGEAMSCRIPCVVTDAGDSAELIGDTGIVVPVKSPERLAAGTLEMIRMGVEKRRALGDSARERIRLNYSMEQAAQQYADLYRSVYERETSRRS